MPGPDMRDYLLGLVGQTIQTLTGKPNRILRVKGGTVFVGTQTNESGGPVSINFVQDAVDRVFDGEEVRLESTGRYGFVGAVLDTFEDVEVLGGPRRARLLSPPQRSIPWTEGENRAAVDTYLDMLDKQLSGVEFVKKTLVESLREGDLRHRSRRSVESRFQNISFVMESNGLPWVKGYAPLRNVGTEMKVRIEKTISDRDTRFLDDFRPTADLSELEGRAERIRSRAVVEPPASVEPPEQRVTETKYFVRDPRVVAWVLEEARGDCEMCREPGPFLTGGKPFLEVHHVIPLSQGGPDSIENAVAICPNCHRECHLADDWESATARLYESVARLRSL